MGRSVPHLSRWSCDARLGSAEVGLSSIAGECDEVEVSGLLVTNQALRHGWRVAEEVREGMAICGDGGRPANPHLRSEMWGTRTRRWILIPLKFS